MIKRQSEEILKEWYTKKRRKPLVLRGARQVGKSTLVKLFAEYLDENSPGVDTTISISCDECNNEMKVALPVTESFFRRTVRKGD